MHRKVKIFLNYQMYFLLKIQKWQKLTKIMISIYFRKSELISATKDRSKKALILSFLKPKKGAIFEKRLISKWIQENGTDPGTLFCIVKPNLYRLFSVNDGQLDTDQLIEVRPESIVRPKAPNHTSIPAILKALQDETDSIMLNK